jgi:uncharacterized protein (DUF1697 family)
MIKTQYLALLRGINVGGNNIIKMVDLKTCFEKIGFTNVLTYIQSGNVIFKSEEKNKTKLTNHIEKALSACFDYKSKIVLITHNQLETIVNEAPKGFGCKPDKYRYDVIFLKDNLTPNELINSIKRKEGVDTANVGNLTLYFSRLISKAGQSHLKYIITLPAYQNMTVRNWNTSKMLLEMMNKNKNTNA